MAILTKGNTFADGDQVTSTKLNNLVDAATFRTGAGEAVDGTTLLVDAGGYLKVGTVQTGNLANGSVTTDKLNSSVVLTPTGAVMAFAMNSAPTGWLAADGSAVSRATYSALFAAISTIYGAGDGLTTFNLPDLRGYFVRGLDNSRNIDPGRAIGTNQADELKSHTHSMYNHPGTDNGSSTGAARFYEFLGSGAVDISATGGTETRPKNIAMLYCIKI